MFSVAAFTTGVRASPSFWSEMTLVQSALVWQLNWLGLLLASEQHSACPYSAALH